VGSVRVLSSEKSGNREQGGVEQTKTYPRSVRQRLIQKSGPHPDIMRTPTGGTVLRLGSY
jgi:hypothetical protein